MAQVDADADAIPVDGGPPGHDAGDGDRQPSRRGTAGATRPRRGYHMERFNDLFSFQTGFLLRIFFCGMSSDFQRINPENNG